MSYRSDLQFDDIKRNQEFRELLILVPHDLSASMLW